MSTEGYELFAIPLETIIVEFSKERRYSTQSEASSRLTAQKVLELREEFEHFLSSGDLQECKLENLQKLLFLDYFYDCKRQKSIKFKDNMSIYQACNGFLNEIIVNSKEQIMINDENSENSFLAQFEMLFNDNPSLFPIFKNSEAFSWFSKQSKSFNRKIEQEFEQESNKEEETIQDQVLEMLILTFNYHLKALFYYFQKLDSKFINNWMKQSLSSLPKFILDELKVKHETRQSFKQLLVYKEDELNNSTIIDADFDFLDFLALNTGDWKARTKLSKARDFHIYTSKENYMSTPRTTIYKFVYILDKSIEQFSKAYLSYDFSGERTLISSYWDYEPMNINHSSKKYSIVKGELVFNPNIPLFSKRRTDAVFSSKAKFIGNQLVQSSFLFKTCSLENNQKCLAMGGTIIRKLDDDKCQVIEIKMFNVKGVMQTDLIMDQLALKVYVKQIRELMLRIIAKCDVANRKCSQGSKPKLVWMTFCDQCLYHYNINVEGLLVNKFN